MRPSELMGKEVWCGRRRARVVGADLSYVQVVFDDDADKSMSWRHIKEVTMVDQTEMVDQLVEVMGVAADDLLLEVDVLYERLEKTKKSLRIEEFTFDEAHGKGCRFIVTDEQGSDHVVAEWRGDGIASDTIFVEKPKLSYGVTTTPFQRCVRMAFEMAHWPLVCVMLAGPGDGELKPLHERVDDGDVFLTND